ncbi:MAG: sulfotransferase, partial [Promethearchaeati archaeon]
LEAVKKLGKDNSCLKGETGKAVKVISHLLKFIPKNNEYKVIFMNRDINEVIKSQQKMLGDFEKKYPKVLMKAFDKEARSMKKWALDQENIKFLDLNYTDIINNPSREVNKIINFLNAPLKREKMIRVVDPSLYRSKVKK